MPWTPHPRIPRISRVKAIMMAVWSPRYPSEKICGPDGSLGSLPGVTVAWFRPRTARILVPKETFLAVRTICDEKTVCGL